MQKSILGLLLIFLITNTLLANNDRALKLYKQKYGGEKKIALVIGNSNYDNKSLSRLKNPVNDSRAVRDKLRQKNFEVLYLEDATQRQIDKIIRKFSKKLKYSRVGLFYFAGHGIEVDKQNYLIPLGANISDIDDIKYETLAVNKIVDKMKRSGTRLNMIILDACRNNPFKRGGSGLASMSNAKGTLIAFATDSGSTASDNSNEKNGLFTKYFLKALDEPLNQREFFHKVRMGVYNASGDKQLPYLNDGTIGDFYFTLDSKVKYVKTNTNQAYLDEIAKLKKELEKQKSKPKNMPTKVSVTNKDVWIDNDTGLIWQKKIDSKRYNWRDAKKYCQNLSLGGYDDWHLPTIKELKTISTKKSYKNSKSYSGETYIKKPLLKSMNMKWQFFWSSSKYDSSEAWIVNFYRGRDYGYGLSYKYYVRCVR